MPRPKHDRDPSRVVTDEAFLEDKLPSTKQDLPKDFGIVIAPNGSKLKKEEQAQAFRVDDLTTKYLGDGKLPLWMKDSRFTTA